MTEHVSTETDSDVAENTVHESQASETVSTSVASGNETEDTAQTTTEAAWYDILPEGLKDHPQITKYKSVEDLAVGKLNADKMVGMDKMPVPTENTPKEILDDIYTKLGRPDSPEAYEWKGIGDQEPDPILTNFMGPVLHEAGLNKKQQSYINDKYNELVSQQAEAQMQAWQSYQDQAVQSLKAEWGPNFDTNISRAKDVVARYGNEELQAIFDDDNGSGLGNDPNLIRLLANIAQDMGEDEIAAKGEGSMRTADTIKDEITKIQKDKSHPYWDEKSPLHKKAIQDVTNLYNELEKYR